MTTDMGLFRKRTTLKEIVGGILDAVPPSVFTEECMMEMTEFDVTFRTQVKDTVARAAASGKDLSGPLASDVIEFIMDRTENKGGDILTVRISFRPKRKQPQE